MLRTLLNSNGKPATVPLTETKIKTENVPQSDEATKTGQLKRKYLLQGNDTRFKTFFKSSAYFVR